MIQTHPEIEMIKVKLYHPQVAHRVPIGRKENLLTLLGICFDNLFEGADATHLDCWLIFFGAPIDNPSCYPPFVAKYA